MSWITIFVIMHLLVGNAPMVLEPEQDSRPSDAIHYSIPEMTKEK